MAHKPAFVSRRTLVLLLGLVALASLPAHGGGKRFATEQRLVSASIRSALMDIDVTPLKGKRAALIFDLFADEGGGSFNGGRWSPGLLFSAGTMAGPVTTTTTTSAFQVYNLAEAGTNYSNSSSGGGSTSVSTTLQNGTSNTDGSSTNTNSGSSTNNTSSNGTNSSTTNGSNTNTSTTNGSGANTSSGSGTNTNVCNSSNSGRNNSQSTTTN